MSFHEHKYNILARIVEMACLFFFLVTQCWPFSSIMFGDNFEEQSMWEQHSILRVQAETINAGLASFPQPTGSLDLCR